MAELQPTKKSKLQAVTVVACFGMIVFALFMHLLESWSLVTLAVMAVVGIAVMFLAAFLWDKIPAFRRFVRGALIAIPSAVIALAIACVVEGMIVDPYTTLSYEIGTFGTLALQFAQAFIVFFLPTMVAAAAFGYRFDRIMLLLMAFINLAAIVYFILWAIPYGYMYVDEKTGTAQTLYMLYAAVATLLCIVVAAKGMWHMPKKKKK